MNIKVRYETKVKVESNDSLLSVIYNRNSHKPTKQTLRIVTRAHKLSCR